MALAGLATLTVFGLGFSVGSRVATGADTFGYVSQAYLWLKGDPVPSGGIDPPPDVIPIRRSRACVGPGGSGRVGQITGATVWP